MDYYITLTLSICGALLESGAEINRVEDTARRILLSKGFKSVNVFCISSLIILSADNVIRIKRVTKNELNLRNIDYFNEMSRSLCEERSFEYLTKPYTLYIKYIAVILGCGCFTLYFGGTLLDAAFSSLIGIIINFRKSYLPFSFVKTLCDSFIAGLISVILSLSAGLNYDKIMIGAIMLLVPGITSVNGVKDIMKADIVSGIMELTDALFTAFAIALGFSAAALILK
ncbi:MAG: threonine/serine exporter family protein [Eubacterium sp.]|nr:threonine/serine exporter family protein [Eubacterium sp.]